MPDNQLFIRKLLNAYYKGVLFVFIWILSTITFAQQPTIKIDTTENKKLIELIDKHIENTNKENLDMNLSTLSNSLSTFQTWLSLLAFVFPLISVIAGFIVFFYGKNMAQKKLEAENKLREIEKLHGEILKMKDDIKVYKDDMLAKTDEVENLKKIVEYRETKDRISAGFLSRMLDYGVRNKENTENIEALIERLDWLRANGYKESQYDLYIRGVHAFYNKKYEKALDFFSESVSTDTSYFFHLAYDAKANCYFKIKDFDRGYECAKTILRNLPYDFRALSKLIFCCKLKKDYSSADKFINQLKISNSSEYIVQKALLNILQSKPDDQLFTGTNENSFNTTKGITKLLLGKYGEASEEFKLAILKMNRTLDDETTDGEKEYLKYTLAQINLNMAYCLFKINYSKYRSTVVNLVDESDKIDIKFRDELGIEMINSNYSLFIIQEEINNWSELRQAISA